MGKSELASPLHFRAEGSKAQAAHNGQRRVLGSGLCLLAQVFTQPACFVLKMLLSLVAKAHFADSFQKATLLDSLHTLLDGAGYPLPHPRAQLQEVLQLLRGPPPPPGGTQIPFCFPLPGSAPSLKCCL